MKRALLLAALLAVAACNGDSSDNPVDSTELSRAKAEQSRTVQQADADVAAAQAAANRARQAQTAPAAQTAQPTAE